MKYLCKLVGHAWCRHKYHVIHCSRCCAEPYEDTTLPEWLQDSWRFGLGRTLRNFVKRMRLYAKSRKCWKPGHDWSPYSDRCQRCGMTGIEDAERGEWMLPTWKLLWKGWLRDRARMAYMIVALPFVWAYRNIKAKLS